MITFYDGASGRTRIISPDPDFGRISISGANRIGRLRAQLAELTNIPAHKQILLTPQGMRFSFLKISLHSFTMNKAWTVQ